MSNSSSEAPSSAPRRKLSRKKRIVLIAAPFLAILTALLIIALWPSDFPDSLALLTPEQFAKAGKPGPLIRLKNRMEWAIHPFRRFMHRGPRPLVDFEYMVYTLSPSASDRFNLNLGMPSVTNAAGLRAWVLSADELSVLREQLKSSNGISKISSPRINTAEGVVSQMSVGSNVPIGGAYVNAGLSVEINPKKVRDPLQLLISATLTSVNAGSNSAPPTLATNFTFACRAAVPDCGAVILDAGKSGNSNYWVILAPTLVDARGNPIRARH